MVIFLPCFLSFFSLFPSRFSTLAFLCVWTFSCLFPFLSFLLFTPPLYLCVSVFVPLSFFLLLSSLADPLYYSLFLSHLFLLSYFFDFPLCLSFTHFKLCICFPSPLLCILLPTFLSLSYSLPLPFSLSPSTPRLPLPVIPLFSMI